MKKDITLEINGQDIRFSVSGADYRNYQDDITMSKKTVPSDRLLLATVNPEDRATLQPYIDQGHGLAIAAELLEQYSDGLKIVVKKSPGG